MKRLFVTSNVLCLLAVDEALQYNLSFSSASAKHITEQYSDSLYSILADCVAVQQKSNTLHFDETSSSMPQLILYTVLYVFVWLTVRNVRQDAVQVERTLCPVQHCTGT